MWLAKSRETGDSLAIKLVRRWVTVVQMVTGTIKQQHKQPVVATLYNAHGANACRAAALVACADAWHHVKHCSACVATVMRIWGKPASWQHSNSMQQVLKDAFTALPT